jgi:hypothetical protein
MELSHSLKAVEADFQFGKRTTAIEEKIRVHENEVKEAFTFYQSVKPWAGIYSKPAESVFVVANALARAGSAG